ncbi:MAG TPA: amidohydrolase family protein [Bryobacteraceae bacterium]|nr:amidohydrolase family protein [Bryobacteraceae bacterium]
MFGASDAGTSVIGRSSRDSSVLRVEFEKTSFTAVDELIHPPEVEEFLAPGFIDLQVNGFAGVDYNDPDSDHDRIAQSIQVMFTTGVTRFFPTVITGSETRMTGAIRNLAAAKRRFASAGMPEAHAMFGFHIEGPHLSPEDGPRGAHPLEHIRAPDFEEFERWQAAADGDIRLVTISPEWEEAPGYIRSLIRSGVVASIGHTKATSEQIQAAVDAGATMSTHLGNAAHATLHKTQNYIWDQLAQDRLTASFIVDGIHIPRAFLKTAVRGKGVERSVLVTDAVMPAMCAPGFYNLGQVEVQLRANGSVVMQGGDRLAGSALRMDHAIANTVRMAGLSLTEVLAMATTNAARVGRVSGRLRGLVPGEKADVVLFLWDSSSTSLEVKETIVAGTSVYRAKSK